MGTIITKRVYAEVGPDDGCRVLVDRLWPRGLTKEKARIDHWFKDLAPSDALRKWFGHDPARWDEFRRRYFVELDRNPGALAPLIAILGKGKSITLLFGAKDEARNNAIALVEYLRTRSSPDTALHATRTNPRNSRV
jgi:uncharacterized protein YeaO (DUF488 family)